MFDLTTTEGVLTYLEQTPFSATNVATIAGGYSNFTYRITLREPHVAPGLGAPIKTLVMKHAQPYIAGWKEFPFSVERQEFECLAFKLVPELVGPSSIVCLPTLYYEDRANRVILMTDCGSNSRTLKAFLQSGPLSDNLARDIGAEIGMFIARLHTSTRNPAPGTPAHNAKTAFASNLDGRKVMAMFFFSRIVPTLTEDPLLLSPPLILSPERLAKLHAFSQKAQERVNTSNEVLNMGDFWTGNMLLVLDPGPRFMVIDWETARPGFPGMDLGSFLAELHLLRVFHPKSRACVDVIIFTFMSAYRAIALDDGNCIDAEHRLLETAYDTATRIGTHLITITPQLPWGRPELTREVVQEGVEYILRSVDGDEAWLRGSIVGGFWG